MGLAASPVGFTFTVMVPVGESWPPAVAVSQVPPAGVVTVVAVAQAAVSVGVVDTVTVCAGGALPPAWAEKFSGVLGDKLSVGQAVVPVLGHTATIVPLIPNWVASLMNVPVSMVYVPELAVSGELIRLAEKGTGSGAGRVFAGSETVATKPALMSPPSSLNVHSLSANVSLAPGLAVNTPFAVQGRERVGLVQLGVQNVTARPVHDSVVAL